MGVVRINFGGLMSQPLMGVVCVYVYVCVFLGSVGREREIC